MLEKIRDWLKVVRRDLLHAASGTNYCQGLNLSFQSYLITLLKPEYQLVFLYRIYSEIYKRKPKIIGYLLYLFVKFIYKCDLHPKSVIGPGFMVMHGFDLVVGPDVRIGTVKAISSRLLRAIS